MVNDNDATNIPTNNNNVLTINNEQSLLQPKLTPKKPRPMRLSIETRKSLLNKEEKIKEDSSRSKISNKSVPDFVENREIKSGCFRL